MEKAFIFTIYDHILRIWQKNLSLDCIIYISGAIYQKYQANDLAYRSQKVKKFVQH